MSLRKLQSFMHRIEGQKSMRQGHRRHLGGEGTGWDNMAGMMGGVHRGVPMPVRGMRRHHGMPYMSRGEGALLGGDWSNMSGTQGGVLLGGDWENMSGVQGGELTGGGRRPRHRRHGHRRMGGDWLNQSGTKGGVLLGGVLLGGRPRRHLRRRRGGNADDYQHVGSDWQNMPGYQGGDFYAAHPTRGVVNFTNNQGYYPPPSYDQNKFSPGPSGAGRRTTHGYNDPGKVMALRDMLRRNRNAVNATGNTSGVGLMRSKGYGPLMSSTGGASGGRKPSAFNAIVKQVMSERGCKLGEASKIASQIYKR